MSTEALRTLADDTAEKSFIHHAMVTLLRELPQGTLQGFLRTFAERPHIVRGAGEIALATSLLQHPGNNGLLAGLSSDTKKLVLEAIDASIDGYQPERRRWTPTEESHSATLRRVKSRLLEIFGGVSIALEEGEAYVFESDCS